MVDERAVNSQNFASLPHAEQTNHTKWGQEDCQWVEGYKYGMLGA